MATDQLMAPLPQITLEPGMQIVFEAINPTTGAAVNGVTVKGITIYGTNAAGGDGLSLTPGPFMLVPGPEG